LSGRGTQAVLARLEQEADLIVGDNEPYRMDETDHTVPRHCFPRGLPYLELEVRQDLIATPAGEDEWADRLARVFTGAAATLAQL
jgi:predicted N-formylglutamate amidohydrolase